MMRKARSLPKMLDSRRGDGGVLRLMTQPGGKLYERAGQKRTMRGDEVELSGGQLVPMETRPLLIQHAVESDEDYAFRAAIAAPRNGFWHSVDALAGRPFGKGIVVTGGLPSELDTGGAWISDIDMTGNDLRAFATAHARDTAGYGLCYVLADFSEERQRPFARFVDADSVTHVEPGDGGTPERMELVIVEEEDGKEVQRLMVIHRGGEGGRETFAWHQIRELSDGKVGDVIRTGSHEPHVEIPLTAWPTGRMTRSHYVLPPLLDAAQLDYLLLQLTSNTEFATITANTFLRFAKGLAEKDINDWRNISSKLFYATTSKDADMKWVTLPADSIRAGMDMAEAVMRSIEVAGLAPMMTRSTGDEKATGQAIASARALSVAESFALQWASALSSILASLAIYSAAPSAEPIAVQLTHDFGVTETGFDHAKMLAQLYMDPREKIPPSTFWAGMRQYGVLADSVDVEELAKWSESREFRLEKGKLDLGRAQVLASLAGQGFFAGEANRVLLYEQLKRHGVIAGEFDAAAAARDDAAAGLLVNGSLVTLRSAQDGI